ncbi:hypothetical protein [Hyphomicrobium sp.]|uniref:hypothetical protein n=1 Tax=Hyphomicrobium sp. TaxID=82 RepID=UPI001D7547BA|nr:hypothetical protein [Hyphomicrobium sp.]MBY0560128.1 hypothetical protein [Hyphomicrobium sp.]
MNDRKKEALDNFLEFILSDNSPVEPEDQSSVDLFNSAINAGEARVARARFVRAKVGAATWAQQSNLKGLDLERARRLLERAKAGDETARITLAARFGDGSMEGDIEAILEDLAELEDDDREKD